VQRVGDVTQACSDEPCSKWGRNDDTNNCEPWDDQRVALITCRLNIACVGGNGPN